MSLSSGKASGKPTEDELIGGNVCPLGEFHDGRTYQLVRHDRRIAELEAANKTLAWKVAQCTEAAEKAEDEAQGLRGALVAERREHKAEVERLMEPFRGKASGRHYAKTPWHWKGGHRRTDDITEESDCHESDIESIAELEAEVGRLMGWLEALAGLTGPTAAANPAAARKGRDER